MNYRGRSLNKTLTWTHTQEQKHTDIQISCEKQQCRRGRRGPRTRNNPGCICRLWFWSSCPPISPAAVFRSCPPNPHDSTVCGLVLELFLWCRNSFRFAFTHARLLSHCAGIHGSPGILFVLLFLLHL